MRVLGRGLLLSLAGLVSCTFAPTGPGPSSAAAASSAQLEPLQPADATVIAIVDDVEITAGDLRRKILSRYYGRRALEGVIREELFTREARRLGIVVAPEELEERVNAEIQALAAPFDSDVRRLEADLLASGVTLSDYRAELRLELRNVLLLERVIKRRRERGGVTEKAIHEEFERSYAAPRVLLRHIAVPANAPAADAARFDAAMHEARRRAEEVHMLLEAGEDFGRLARLRSADRTTGEQGGLVGWVARGELSATELEDEVFALRVGEFSEPVFQDGYGYHVFRVDEERPARTLEEVREEIRAALLSRPPTAEEVRSAELALRARSRILILMDPPAAMPVTTAQERTGE